MPLSKDRWEYIKTLGPSKGRTFWRSNDGQGTCSMGKNSVKRLVNARKKLIAARIRRVKALRRVDTARIGQAQKP